MSDRLEVVAAGLLNTLVRVDGGVTRSTSQVFAIFVRDMLALRVLEALGEPEINDENVVLLCFRAANKEIVGFDIPMDDSLLVHLLNALDHLRSNQQHCLEVELALARLEQVLNRGSEQIHDHDMELLVGHRVVRADVVKARHTR